MFPSNVENLKNKEMRNDIIYLLTDSDKIEVNCDEILYVENSLQFSRIIFLNEEKLETLMTIDEVENLLTDKGFFRFNNKYLVNLRFVQAVIPSDASKVILENGKEIFVSHNKKDELFKSLRIVYELHELA